MQATRTMSRNTRRYRRVHQLTRTELAHKAGVTHGTIKAMEEAEWTTYNPSMGTVVKMAKATNMALNQFLSTQ